MTKLARLPANDGAPDHEGTAAPRRPRFRHRFFAFLSYSHKDKEIADWLHDELEEFHVPHGLAGRLTENGVIPKRLRPIFRDRHELAAADDLGEEITAALASSQYLIVLCSPDAAKSQWTNAEIEMFKRTRPDGCVLAAIASGEPYASDIPGREDEECFPPALRQKYDRRGRPTGKRAEPLAADLREIGDGRRMGFLRLVAGMLGTGLDDLVQRDTTRRHRRLAWLAAGSLAGMAVTSGLAVTAIQARDAARDQRREAEGLVAFMVGDLKDKLEPIGKLDALDGVGARVLAYYSKQDTSELSDPALLQRARALSLMGEVANLRGDSNGAEKLYKEAAAGTEEAVSRNPDDPQSLFEHAQNIYYLGDLARQRGDGAGTERAMRQYKALALRMVSLDPNNMKYRTEVRYADANLGIALAYQRRFAEAAAQFQEALTTIEAMASVDQGNHEYEKAFSEALGWLGEAQMSQGRLREAIATRERQIGLLNRFRAASNDVAYEQKLVPAERGLGGLYRLIGELDRAEEHFRSAVSHGEHLIALEPNNSKWAGFTANARLSLAATLLEKRRLDDSANETGTACDSFRRLSARDPKMQDWRAGLRDCWLMRARLASANGNRAEALQDSLQAVGVAKSVKSNDTVWDRYLLAAALRLEGDTRQGLGDSAAARQSWQAALAVLPPGVAERPSEMSEHATILVRLGRAPEARQLTDRLKAMGYRQIG
jgi:tetratricopeptide (TPR) repeat protein